jgi:tetratricopeptide (TPR) repeat protein
MSKGAGLTGETWGKRGSFDEIKSFISQKWSDQKDIIDIAYGNGEWVAILAEGADYSSQVYRWDKAFPHAWCQEKYNNGYNITGLTYGDGVWLVVMSKLSKQMPEKYLTDKTFLSKFIDDEWKAGKRIAFMHYNYEKNLQSSFDDLYNAGVAAASDNDHELAVYYFTEALKVKPNDFNSYNNRAWSKYLMNQCTGALSDANQSIAISPNEFNYHTRACIYLCLDRCREALTDYDKAFSLATKKESYYYGDRGLARACLGDNTNAETDLKKAIELEPGNKLYKESLDKVQSKLKEAAAPTITWDQPFKDYTTSAEENYKIKACIHSTAKITDVQVFLNGKSFSSRGFAVDDDCTQSVDQAIKLLDGKNELEIIVKTEGKTYDKWGKVISDGISTKSEKRVIEYRAAKKSGNYHALLLAVENYDDFSFRDLEKPIDDATELQNILTSDYNFQPNDVIFLKNPKKEEILAKLAYFQDKLGPEDNLLIYYSGHGIVKNEVGYWLPGDAQKESRMAWLSNAELRDYMNGMKARHTLIIADACFSGSIFNGSFRDAEEFACEEMAKVKSRRAMTSGAGTVVPDESVFFKYLIQKLKENTAGCLSAESLYSKIKPAVIYNSPNNHIPQFGVLPQVGDEGGNFIFRKKK